MNDLAARWARLGQNHFWPPYTSSEDYARRPPLAVASARGSWLVDTDGRRYLDACGSWWCNNLGHSEPRLVEALHRQAKTLAHCAIAGAVHEPAMELAAQLTSAAPKGLDRVFYSDDGSTSVEVAVKIAFQYFQQNGEPERRRFLTLPGGYHGDTFGAMSVGRSDDFFGVFTPLLFGARESEPDPKKESIEDAIARIEATLNDAGPSVAGVVVEPIVQGASGMRVYAPELLERLRKACDRSGALLIADEVFTGFGRTGTMWACEHANVVPDLLCTAKGLSAGMLPFAATLASARLFEGFAGDSSRAFMHGHTFCGNPLGAAIALEVLRIYATDHIVEESARRGEILKRGMARLSEIDGTHRPRALGMVAAIDLGDEGYYGGAGWRVHELARERGVWIRPLGDALYVCPPLTTEDADLEALFGVLEECVRAAI